MNARQPGAGGPVALVIQRRIAEAGFAAFTRWTGALGEELRDWPGFLGQEVVPPQPPAQVDWVLILRFASAEAARGWLRSEARERLIDEVRPHFVGPEDVRILPASGEQPRNAVSAVVSFSVPAGLEAEFLVWQERIQAAEAAFPGFLRRRLERPIPGLHEDWVAIISFDSDIHLRAWLDSAERQALLAEGERFNAGLSVKRITHGFNFWLPEGEGAPAVQSPGFVMKSNLLVLLVLYPIVYLWGFFLGGPLLDAQGVPFWLSLFIGNLVSTQLLGWWVVPAAFKAFDWWLAPRGGVAGQVAGYALVGALYILSMALYAGLLAWNWGR